MYFHKALLTVMETQQVSVQELARRTNSDPRWILTLTTDCKWKPQLDTILRLCYALKFNVFSFIALAEIGLYDNTLNSHYSRVENNNDSLTEHMNQILDFQPRHISLALKAFRLECGLSQRKLEKLTPFNIHTICTREGERYRNYPTITTLCSYCDAYQIGLEEFVSRAFSFIGK